MVSSEDDDYGLAATFAGDDYEDTDYVAPESESDHDDDELPSASASTSRRGASVSVSGRKRAQRRPSSKSTASQTRASGSLDHPKPNKTVRPARPASSAKTKPKPRSLSKGSNPSRTTSGGPSTEDDGHDDQDDYDDDDDYGGLVPTKSMLLPSSAYRPYQRKSTVYDCTAGLSVHVRAHPPEPEADTSVS